MIKAKCCNAKQALLRCKEPRKINVRMVMNKAGDKLELDVIDNGTGVPENIRDNIFDPFFTTKSVGDGTGIGLSLVRGIVKSHGGTVDLVQNGDSGGHFRVLVPHVGRMLPRKNAAINDIADEPKQRILIVDDEADVLSALEDILLLQGHKVLAVNSGTAALIALESRKFDGILSDIRMPEMDGEQLFSAIQGDYPDMVDHIAFITGNDLSEQTKAFLDTCNCPYLGKPFIPAEVATLVLKISAQKNTA